MIRIRSGLGYEIIKGDGMKVLNLLSTGNAGGIEVLCRDAGMISENNNVFVFMFSKGVIFDQMKRLGLNVTFLQGKKRLTVGKLKQLIALAHDCDVIVVHHNDPYLQLYYYLLMKKYPNKKYVSIRHSCFNEGTYFKNYALPKKFLRKWALETCLNKSDHLVFVSNAGFDSFKAYYDLDAEKCSVIYNGIGVDKIENGKNNVPDKSSAHILFVGRLYEGKGVDLLISAAAKLKDEYDFDITIVGDGVSREKLELLTKENNLEQKIKFEGQQTDVGKYLEKANIFVYPSRVEEVFGISIVEAMSYGLISIANPVGGIPEIITNGENGFLTDEVSVEALAKVLQNVLSLDVHQKETIMRNAKITANRFSVVSTVKQLESLYKGLLSGEK